MIEPRLLDGRRIHAILILAREPLRQCAIAGVGAWDGAHMTLVPDGRLPSLPVPLIEGRAPAYEMTTVRATIESVPADNSATLRNALANAEFLAVWLVASLPDGAALVPEPLSVAWLPGRLSSERGSLTGA